MITENEIRGWFKWLCDTYPTDEVPMLSIAPPEYDCIEVSEGGPVVWALFDVTHNSIHMCSRVIEEVADEEEKILFTELAHEYRHHMQMRNGETFTEKANFDEWYEKVGAEPEYEKDAEAFADQTYARWRREGER